MPNDTLAARCSRHVVLTSPSAHCKKSELIARESTLSPMGSPHRLGLTALSFHLLAILNISHWYHLLRVFLGQGSACSHQCKSNKQGHCRTSDDRHGRGRLLFRKFSLKLGLQPSGGID